MGRLTAPFGVRGWVRVQTFSAQTDALSGHQRWWLSRAGHWEAFSLEESRVHGRSLLAKFAGVSTPEQAAALGRSEVAVPRAELPPAEEGEYYWADLVGLEVRNREGEGLGVVDTLMDNGAQSVLVVRGERERLIPFVDRHVDKVDLQARRIVVDWSLDD